MCCIIKSLPYVCSIYVQNIDMLKSKHYTRWNKESKPFNKYQQMHKHTFSKQNTKRL